MGSPEAERAAEAGAAGRAGPRTPRARPAIRLVAEGVTIPPPPGNNGLYTSARLPQNRTDAVQHRRPHGQHAHTHRNELRRPPYHPGGKYCRQTNSSDRNHVQGPASAGPTARGNRDQTGGFLGIRNKLTSIITATTKTPARGMAKVHSGTGCSDRTKLKPRWDLHLSL